MSFISPDLIDQLNPKHELVVLANKIPWDVLESELTGFYSDKMGRPAKPIRLMVGLMILKQMENLSDERAVEAWVRDPYMQFFCGETQFQWQFPCAPSDLTHFRKLPAESKDLYESTLHLFERVLAQKRSSKNKIYSLHEPDVYCMSKGKEHKKYEFGAKASIVTTKNSGIIVGALSLSKNIYDGHTLDKVLNQVKELRGERPEIGLCDRGYRGRARVGDTRIMIPRPPLKRATVYEKQKTRKRFRRRAAIEPIIGHLKSDYRLGRNYLKGIAGDSINLMMAAAAFNFKKLLRRLACFFVSIFQRIYMSCIRIFRRPSQPPRLSLSF